MKKINSMHMKKLILFMLIVPLGLYAQTVTKSKIKHVVVYQQGAKITNEVTINLVPGNNEVVFTELTNSINQNTIQVKVFGEAILLSATSRTRILDDKDLPIRTKALEDSILLVNQKINWLTSEKKVYEGEENIILANQKLGTNEEKVSVDEIIQLSKFYRERLLNIKENMYNIDNELFELDKLKTKLNNKLAELRHSEKKVVGEIVIDVNANKAGNARFEVSYLTHQAGWTPLYDIRAEDAKKPVDLVYKANIWQTTGYNWEKVLLTVSTANPSANNNRPEMYPWYIDFMPETPILFKDAERGAMLNTFQRTMVSKSAAAEEEIFEEAPLIGYDVLENTNRISADYVIDIAQSIPSDGKPHMVAMKEYELNSTYTYHAIPKLDQATYLLAKVADYGKYNLLPGQANLFFEGMYIGQSFINPNTTIDSMLLSMGQDDKINIKRNQLVDLTEKQVIGNNVRETKAYEIMVRNNNSFAIDLDLMDQIPISQNKEIEVKLVESDGAAYDQEYGSLLWKLNLKPGETKKVRLVYSVRYPKGSNIPGL